MGFECRFDLLLFEIDLDDTAPVRILVFDLLFVFDTVWFSCVFCGFWGFCGFWEGLEVVGRAVWDWCSFEGMLVL